jgi:hypothetical protein
MTKKFLLTIFAVGIFLLLSLFILLCWTAAADAQGAVGIFVYAPVLLLLIGLNFYISRFIGLTSFSQKVIGLVSDGFELITRKTPMQWDKCM